MVTGIHLGWVAPVMTIELDAESDWFSELINDDGDYADGTEIYIIFKIRNDPDVRWDAVIDGRVATWYKTSLEVAELLELEPESAKMHHKLNANIVWYKGETRDNT